MNRCQILALAVLTAVSANATAHDEADAGWFVRAGAGVSKTQVDLLFPSIWLHPTKSSLDETDLALSFDSGYRFANGFALSLGYHDRGALDFDTPAYVPPCPLQACPAIMTSPYQGSVGAKDWRVSVDYRIALGERWALIPGLAAAHVDAEVRAHELGQSPGDGYDFDILVRDWRAVPSLSAAYAITPDWAVDAQFEYLGTVGDFQDAERFTVSTLTLGLTYSFH